jgi:hypothetical protein
VVRPVGCADRGSLRPRTTDPAAAVRAGDRRSRASIRASRKTGCVVRPRPCRHTGSLAREEERDSEANRGALLPAARRPARDRPRRQRRQQLIATRDGQRQPCSKCCRPTLAVKQVSATAPRVCIRRARRAATRRRTDDSVRAESASTWAGRSVSRRAGWTHRRPRRSRERWRRGPKELSPARRGRLLEPSRSIAGCPGLERAAPRTPNPEPRIPEYADWAAPR